MNISAINFCARNKDIRKADDIMRRANNVFPMFSPSLANIRWSYIDTEKNSETYNIKERFIDKTHTKLSRQIRKNYIGDLDKYYKKMCKTIKKEKIGNCWEKAVTVLAGLFANRVEKAARVSLDCDTRIINKKTGKTEYLRSNPIDHTTVVTSMNNPKKEGLKNLIVVDGWLGKVMTIDEAEKEYLKLLSKREQLTLKKVHFDNFIKEHKNDPDFNEDNYKIKQSIGYNFVDSYTKKEAEEFSKIALENYPELSLDTII